MDQAASDSNSSDDADFLATQRAWAHAVSPAAPEAAAPAPAAAHNQVLFLRQQRLIAWIFWWQWFTDPVGARAAAQSPDTRAQRVKLVFDILVGLLPGAPGAFEERAVPLGSLTVMGSLYEAAWMMHNMVPAGNPLAATRQVVGEMALADDKDYVFYHIDRLKSELTARYRERHGQPSAPFTVNSMNGAVSHPNQQLVPPNLQEDTERAFFAMQIAGISMKQLNVDWLLNDFISRGQPLDAVPPIAEFDTARRLYDALIDLTLKSDEERLQPTAAPSGAAGGTPRTLRGSGRAAERGVLSVTRVLAPAPAMKRTMSRLITDPLFEAQLLVARNEAAKKVHKRGDSSSVVFALPASDTPEAVEAAAREVAQNNGSWVDVAASSSSPKTAARSRSKPAHKRTASAVRKLTGSSKKDKDKGKAAERKKNRLSWAVPPPAVVAAPGAALAASPSTGTWRIAETHASPRTAASVSSAVAASDRRARTTSIGAMRSTTSAEQLPSIIAAAPALPQLPSLPIAAAATTAKQPQLTLEEWTSLFATPLDVYAFCEQFVAAVEDWLLKKSAAEIAAEGMHAFISEHTSVATLDARWLGLNKTLFELSELVLDAALLYDVDFLHVLHMFAQLLMTRTIATRVNDNALRMFANRAWAPAARDEEDMAAARLISLIDTVIQTFDNHRTTIESDLSARLVADPSEDPLIQKLLLVVKRFRAERVARVRLFTTPPPPPPDNVPEGGEDDDDSSSSPLAADDTRTRLVLAPPVAPALQDTAADPVWARGRPLGEMSVPGGSLLATMALNGRQTSPRAATASADLANSSDGEGRTDDDSEGTA